MKKDVLNIAHRGYSAMFDENTMIAFKKAIEYKADGIETDVQLSKDGVPVIIHDETLDRTTNGKGFVKDYTLAQLKEFKTTNGEEIPTLRELLDLFSKSKMEVLNLELKNSILEYDGIEEKVLDLIDEFDLKDRIIISTFNHLSLIKIREIEKQRNTVSKIKLGALTESTLANVDKYLKDIDVQCYHPFFPSILNKEYSQSIIKSGIEINPYTVNEIEDFKRVIDAGVTCIITNEVEKLYNYLN